MITTALLISDEHDLALAIRESCLTAFENDVCVCISGSAQGMATVRAQSSDIVVIDADPLGSSAFELARLCKLDRNPALIFLSRERELAVEAFNVDAVDFVLKPASVERLVVSMCRARAKVSSSRSTASPGGQNSERAAHARANGQAGVADHSGIWVEGAGQGYSHLSTELIELVTSEGDYVRVHSRGRSYLVRSTLKALHQQLGDAQFLRVHRTSLVRLDLIRAYRRDGRKGVSVYLENGASIPVGRAYNANVRKSIGISTSPRRRPNESLDLVQNESAGFK